MKKIKFVSKAYNLNELKNKNFKSFMIPKFYFFSVFEWNTDKKKIITEINSKLSKYLCIRSSFIGEDTSKNSLAGKFDSYLKIKNNDIEIKKYVNLLIKQYTNFNKKNLEKNHILIQNFVTNNICSGVMTNFCISDGSPYYTINYDDISKSTESVTSGNKNSFRVLYIHKKHHQNIRNKNFKKLIITFKEIEKVYSNMGLDIEFSINKKNEINILQIRPISEKIKWIKFNEREFEKNLKLNKEKYDRLKKKFDKQKDLIFSCMSDWNPAEMIGVQPDYLSYSLYNHFITKKAWFIARKKMNYGFGDHKRLMENFLGKPYINLNLSFDSLIPSDVNKNLRNKLVSNWLKEIKNKPFLHDKIEFDLVLNCFYFGIDKRIDNYDFLSHKEKNYLYDKLKDHTCDLINNFEKDLTYLNLKLKSLEDIRSKYQSRKLSQKIIKENLKILSQKLEPLGIVPFAKFARYAFIGKSILISMLKEKIISTDTYNKILSRISTVSNDYVKDKKKLKSKKIDRIHFDNLYFHLRPGSYDIKSKRYNPKIKSYKIGSKINKILDINEKNKVFEYINNAELEKIKIFLNSKINQININTLFRFIINSMRLRENSKFIFTRTLSDIIELINKINFKKKINVENINFPYLLQNLQKNVNINNLQNINFSSINNRASKLSYLIQSNNDFFVSSILMTRPNFISQKKIKSKILDITQKNNSSQNLNNKIILIENADPGYDWIFSYKIRGLITKYGGVNSHMSIRCEEKQLPAIIGVGEELFENIKKKQNIEMDCKLQRINFLN